MKEQLDKTIFDNCKWCNGGGKEPDGHYPCPDCQGTGMKGGKYAEQKYDEYIEQMEREAFLKELSDLSKKYGMYIGGCGCCSSPYVDDENGNELLTELGWNDEKQKYEAD